MPISFDENDGFREELNPSYELVVTIGSDVAPDRTQLFLGSAAVDDADQRRRAFLLFFVGNQIAYFDLAGEATGLASIPATTQFLLQPKFFAHPFAA